MAHDEKKDTQEVGLTELVELYGKEPEFKNEPQIKVIGLDPDSLVISYNSLRKRRVKPLEQVLDPILCKGGLMMVHAATGVGKSHFCLNLAYAIALGGKFLKYKAPKPLKVLYVDGELGQDDMHRYLDPIIRKQGELDFPDNFSYFCADTFPQSNIPKIDTPEGQRFYKNFMLKHGIQVVVFDNLKMLSNLDENKTQGWDVVQQMLLEFRAEGICTILVHHAGSDVTKQRGITARMDALNTVISLQKVGHESIEFIRVVYQKNRHFHGDAAKSYEAINNFDGSWDYTESETTTYDQVIAWFKIGANGVTIAGKLNISPQAVSKHRNRAIAEGKLETDSHGRIRC